MVRILEEEKEILKSKLGQLKGMFEGGARQGRSSISENGSANDDRAASTPLHANGQSEPPMIGDPTEDVEPRSANTINPHARERQHSDMEMLKEKFAKLLLGEDMSGGGKGVSSALALSNAITNLAASVFGEQKRLEPMAPETKTRWIKEIEWLLSVTDYIVEFVPSKQRSIDGTNMEIMVTRQRADLHINIPALRKLDAMLLECLDNFKDQNEFYYASSKDEKSDKGPLRNDDKWWIPIPKVPPNGLSEVTRKWMQFQKDSVNQVLKAALAINAQILMEMEIPESYIEALPKNGRESLGDAVYKSITDDHFGPDIFLSSVDLSSELKILDLKNRIEASVEIWKRKKNAKDAKSSWGSTVSMEKRELFGDRAETILQILKYRFPSIPQSDLDISKIQCNKDVGLAILESYSRVIESLASTVLSRIDAVMQADALARTQPGAEQKTVPSPLTTPRKTPSSGKEDNPDKTPTSKVLPDFIVWQAAEGETVAKKDCKPPNIVTDRKLTYIERLGSLGGLRSPTARH